MPDNKVITAVFGSTSQLCRTRAIWQYDRGRQLQISGITLPISYQVQFANGPAATAKPIAVYDSDTVEIPEEFTQSGQPVYAYIYITGDEYGITKRLALIPVQARGAIDDVQPTPQEASAIDALIEALNSGVTDAVTAAEAAEAAAQGIDQTVQTALAEAKASGEFDGPQGEPGQNGAPGVSPTITVTDITGGHRITITDATGEHSFNVMDGEDGSGAVKDVQVNGVSVLLDGVANVPLARPSTLGAVALKKYGENGLQYIDANYNLGITAADRANIKTSTHVYRPIVPYYQHESTFYGLAKAAGSDEKNSTLPVGQYTDSAKSAIHEMLNGSVAVEGTTPTITALSGIRYICGEVSTLDVTVPASGIVDVVFQSGSTTTVLTVTTAGGQAVQWANGFDTTSLEANTVYEINVMDGLGVAGAWS